MFNPHESHLKLPIMYFSPNSDPLPAAGTDPRPQAWPGTQKPSLYSGHPSASAGAPNFTPQQQGLMGQQPVPAGTGPILGLGRQMPPGHDSGHSSICVTQTDAIWRSGPAGAIPRQGQSPILGKRAHASGPCGQAHDDPIQLHEYGRAGTASVVLPYMTGFALGPMQSSKGEPHERASSRGAQTI